MPPQSWKELSDGLAAIAEKNDGSVVRVEGRRRAPASGVAWSANAIVTAHHVLEWDEEIGVGLPGGEIRPATLVGRDPTTDLALLKLEGARLAVPEWADAGETKVGQIVLALMRPGRSLRASLGVVAARAGEWRAPSGGRLEHYLETDVPLRRGFSGGLLLDASGRALGVNTAGLLRKAAITVTRPTLQRVVEALLAHGRVRRGYLGVGTYPVRLPKAVAERAGQASGLLVLGVEPESPAARANVFQGDVLLTLDGKAVRGISDLIPLLEEERIGREFAARIVRAGEIREFPITIGVRGNPAA